MALVTCPECGRKNVSDSAVACPDCGFGIREYYTNIKEQQQKEEKEKEYRERAQSVTQSLEDDIKKHQARRAEILAQKEAQEKEKSNSKSQTDQETKYDREQLEKKMIEQNRIEAARKKQEQIIEQLRKKHRDFKILSIVFAICGIASIVQMIVYGFVYMPSLLISIFILFLDFFFYRITNETKNDLEIAEKSFAEYVKVIQQRAAEEEKRKAEEARKRELELMKNVPCPVCGSRNTYRIDTLDRATSVAIFGLASGKIGKQYQCRDCKHMW